MLEISNQAKKAYRYGGFDLKPLLLGKLRPERIASNQMVCQWRRSFAWRHKQPIYFFRPQRAAANKLEYASTVWNPHTNKSKAAIEMVKKRAARWVSNKYFSYASVTAMLRKLDWHSLKYRRYDLRLAMFYKIQSDIVAVQMPSYFERP